MENVSKVFKEAKKYGMSSLLARYFMVISVAMIIPSLIVSLCIYVFCDNFIVRETVAEKKENLELRKRMTEIVLDNVIINAQEISRDSAVMGFIKNSDSDFDSVYARTDAVGTLMKNIGKIMAANEMITDVGVYSGCTGKAFLYSAGIVDGELEKMIYENEQVDLKIKAHDYHAQKYVLLSKRMRDADNNAIGLITIYINIATMRQYVSADTKDNELFITDRDGNIFFSMRDDCLGQKIFNQSFYRETLIQSGEFIYDCEVENELYTIVKNPTQYNARNYILMYSNEDYKKRMGMIFEFMVWATICILLISFGIALLFAIRLYRPISAVLRGIEKSGEASAELSEYAKGDEIFYIISHLNISANESDLLRTEVDEKMRLLKLANTRALQMQINPHFIYNAMEAINWKIIRYSGFENEACEMVKSLSKMMRYSLETEHNVVTIREEIESLQSYLNFQKLRFGERVEIHLHVPEEIQEFCIIKLSLQPIVENAFTHGIKYLEGIGKVSVTAVEGEDYIRFDVKDNGVGMQDEEAQKLKEKLKQNNTFVEGQIGIANVDQRIKIVFGETYGVNVVKYAPGDMVFTITVPKMSKKR